MQRFHFPTNIIFGEGALLEGAQEIAKRGFKNPLLVTDTTLFKIGLVDEVMEALSVAGISAHLFKETHPNPIEEDVLHGVQAYREGQCDCILALGGGSPMDAAKGIAILLEHPEPLAKYDDAKGGDQYIDGNKLPSIFAIATTAGTGSEVGRATVIIIKETDLKTILFHPKLLPTVAVLDPTLLVKLPADYTAATGIDAFTHSLEAYFAPGFHPMADGIAKEGMELVLDHLLPSYEDGSNLEHRGRMLMASTMGATAFQKGLGMIHSMAHPLSSECGLHHGLANALLLPESVSFLEESELNDQQRSRIQKVNEMFLSRGYTDASLAKNCRTYFEKLGIKFGLVHHGVEENDLEVIAAKAVDDVCHQSNMIPVTKMDFLTVLQRSFQ